MKTDKAAEAVKQSGDSITDGHADELQRDEDRFRQQRKSSKPKKKWTKDDREFVYRGKSFVVEQPTIRHSPPELPDGATYEQYDDHHHTKRAVNLIASMRQARIKRRAMPHNQTMCEICREHPPHEHVFFEQFTTDKLAELTGFSKSYIHRVFSNKPEESRGRKTLASMRRIAHAMGITLDEFANLVLD